MKILKNDNLYTDEFVIKKSRFITVIKRVYSKSEIEYIIKQNTKNDARHNCWAYSLNDNGNIKESFHNDGEPLGTSGDAILKTIKSMSLTNVIVLVVRYFGGTKLGVGPLSRSYTQGIKSIIKEYDLLKDLEVGIEFTFSFNISNIKKVDSILKTDFIELSRTYHDDLVVVTTTTKNESSLLSIGDLINITDKKNIFL